MKSYAQIPPGTQIVIGRAARRRRLLERTICSVFEGWSYEEIIPPIFDYYDVLSKAWEPVRRNRSIGLSIARETSWRCGPNSPHWWQKRLRRAWRLLRNRSG